MRREEDQTESIREDAEAPGGVDGAAPMEVRAELVSSNSPESLSNIAMAAQNYPWPRLLWKRGR